MKTKNILIVSISAIVILGTNAFAIYDATGTFAPKSVKKNTDQKPIHNAKKTTKRKSSTKYKKSRNESKRIGTKKSKISTFEEMW